MIPKQGVATLAETVALMNSTDYQERLKAEYYQLQIRYEGLINMILTVRKGTNKFPVTAPLELYEAQANTMASYLKILELRAINDKIEL